MENATIKQVLGQIENQTDYFFMYNGKLVNVDQNVSVDIKNKNIDNVLKEVFKGTDINYEIKDRQILLSISNNTSFISALQQKKITGKVTDSSGAPLPGVTVVIKGTTIGTITDNKGNYSLTDIPSNATLLFSFMGMKTQEIAINGKSTINIAMQEESIGIDEVVAIGYGTMKKGKITSSIASVKKEDFVQGAVYQSPLELLSGKVAGLAISRSGGGDPNSSVEFQLRGVSSVDGDKTPLIIIDGVPGGYLSSISPDDIETIDILRDGSAAAIYGTKATNGVILITTKKGTVGKPQVKYSAYAYTEGWYNKPELLTGDEYRNCKEVFSASDDAFLQKEGRSMMDYKGNTDWLDAISRNALSQVHDLSISGGTETLKYYGSFNYRDQEGLIKETGKKMMGGRLSLTYTSLDKKLMIQMNSNNTFTTSHPYNSNILFQAMTRNPTMPVYNKDTDPSVTPDNPDGEFLEFNGYLCPNPVGLIEQYKRDNKNSAFQGNINIKYELLKGLIIAANGAFMRSNTITGYYEDRDSWNSLFSNANGGSASRSSTQSERRSIEPTITYSNLFNDIHRLEVLGGYSYQEEIYENFSAENHTFISDALTYNSLGSGSAIESGVLANPVSSYKSSNKLISFFGRVNYSLKDRYLLSASLRHEGSSKFGDNNKWGNFSAASVGWVISEENFMKDVYFIDNMKLRLGYGVTGNQGVSSYLSKEKLNKSGVMYYNGEWISGYVPASNPNPDLRWEKKAESNLGIDISMFNNINLSIDLYNRKTTDLLYEYSVPVPPNIYNSTWANVGEMSNKGIEFTISATPLKKSKFSWKLNFNASYNKNKLVSLSDEKYNYNYLMLGELGGYLGMTGEYSYKLEEGEPIGNIFAWEFAGFSDDQKWQVWNADHSEKIHPTEATFKDKKVVGNGLPKTWVGFNNTFTYNNFDLSFGLKGAFFFDILNTYAIGRRNVGYLPNNIEKMVITDPEISKVRDTRNYVTDYHVESGDYLKLDNLTIGYSIPVKFARQLRVYVSGKNLFVLTDYSGDDPEESITGLVPSYDSCWDYPKVKTFTFGFKLNF